METNIPRLSVIVPVYNVEKYLKKCIQRTITDYWGRERKTSMKFPTAYVDFLNMIDQCEFQSRVKPYFENIEELSNMHEMMVDIINSKKDEINDLSIITGQKPIITKSKKAIAAFKIREGINIGCKVTLRKGKMYDFA